MHREVSGTLKYCCAKYLWGGMCLWFFKEGYCEKTNKTKTDEEDNPQIQ
jgi:hypothetical protein